MTIYMLGSLLALTLITTGCAQHGKLASPTLLTTQQAKEDSTVQKVGRAAATPLSDLNLVQEGIPPVLLAAKRETYVGRDLPCDALLVERQMLAEALDIDVPTKKKDIVDKGLAALEKQGVNAVQRTVEDVIPFRGWVRKLSGAERHSKEISAAITAGHSRYAYLTGVYHAKHCFEQEPAASLDKTNP